MHGGNDIKMLYIISCDFRVNWSKMYQSGKLRFYRSHSYNLQVLSQLKKTVKIAVTVTSYVIYIL